MKYRPEVDGLRALAVVPVILFHADVGLFTGGFVGVDVFFVISGYLITMLLIEDIADGRFSILHFYRRRARRIFPALFLVMLVCIPFAWMWMLPSELKDFSASVFSTSLFLSNIYFLSQVDYFAPNAELQPLLHTWSLAIEEQYYLFFPPLLVLCLRRGHEVALIILSVCLALSLLFSVWASMADAQRNFFFSLGRFWELFAGAIAAFVVHKQGVRPRNLVALLGLGAIVAPILLYDDQTPFPSLYTVLPVGGVVLLVLFAAPETIAARLLGHKLLVWIGLISYSAYLWHQPLFAFARIRMLEKPPDGLMIALSLMTIPIAYLSWRLVEQPFRRGLIGRRWFFGLNLAGIIGFAALGLFGYFSHGFEGRIQGWHTISALPSVEDSYCHNGGRTTADQMRNGAFCTLGTGVPSIAMIGDSHAGALFESADEYLTSTEIASLAISGGFCAPLLNGFSAGKGCSETMGIALQSILENGAITDIILIAEWGNYTRGYRGTDRADLWSDDQGVATTAEENTKVFQRSFDKTIEELLRAGKTVHVVLPVPEFKQFAYEYLGHRALFDGLSVAEATQLLPPIDLAEYLSTNKEVLDTFARHAGAVRMVEVQDLFCDATQCFQFGDQNFPLYSDFNHLNYVGAQLVVERIFKGSI